MRTTIAHGKLRYQQNDSPLWCFASTRKMHLTTPSPRPERTLTAPAPAVATLSAPPFSLSAGRATILRATQLTPELRRHPVSSTAPADAFATGTRQDEDRGQSGSLGSTERSPNATMTHDPKRASLQTLLRENGLSLPSRARRHRQEQERTSARVRHPDFLRVGGSAVGTPSGRDDCGKREYIQVLRLHEDFPERQVAAAVRDAVKRRLIGFDAVKHLLLARIERRPVHLDLSRYPHLPPALRRRHAERRLRHPAGRRGRPWLRPPASCSNIT